MADYVNMALDDIIRGSETGRGGRSGSRKFNVRKKSGRGGGGGAAGGFRNGRAGGAARGKHRGGAAKPTNSSTGDANGTQNHILFSDFGERKMQRPRPITTGYTKIRVSNLDFGVSDADIQELFSSVGELKSSAVHYDRSRRSLGTADVVFKRKADAIKAVMQYNEVPLDGRAMIIKLATSEVNTFRTEGRSRVEGGAGGSGGPGRRRAGVGGAADRRRGAGGGGARGRRRPGPTAEQLDAELDAYRKEMECSRVE